RDALDIQTFVETGTHYGETAAWAAGEFDRVVTIEAAPHLHDHALASCGHLKNVEFLLGDSREVLPGVVAELTAPAIFWLDGHFCGGQTAGAESECPLLHELGAIRTSSLDHTILIDDARLFLCAPPRPHKSEDWPSIDEVIDGLRRKGVTRRISVIE